VEEEVGDISANREQRGKLVHGHEAKIDARRTYRVDRIKQVLWGLHSGILPYVSTICRKQKVHCQARVPIT